MIINLPQPILLLTQQNLKTSIIQLAVYKSTTIIQGLQYPKNSTLYTRIIQRYTMTLIIQPYTMTTIIQRYTMTTIIQRYTMITIIQRYIRIQQDFND